MTDRRLLLCTDMDRTVIPNGAAAEPADARVRLQAFCQRPQVCLAYVTGRNIEQMLDAITEYDLPRPNYAITDVGTNLYEATAASWTPMAAWMEEIGRDWPADGAHIIQATLQAVPRLQLQEPERQQLFKVSYYTKADTPAESLVDAVRSALAERGIPINAIWSIDEATQTGLLDLLPSNADKYHAIRFLQHHLAYAEEDVIFAGDSGNDLPVLISALRAIVVGNAAAEIKQEARAQVIAQDRPGTLFVATEHYAAGVLEGLQHWGYTVD